MLSLHPPRPVDRVAAKAPLSATAFDRPRLPLPRRSSLTVVSSQTTELDDEGPLPAPDRITLAVLDDCASTAAGHADDRSSGHENA